MNSIDVSFSVGYRTSSSPVYYLLIDKPERSICFVRDVRFTPESRYRSNEKLIMRV